MCSRSTPMWLKLHNEIDILQTCTAGLCICVQLSVAGTLALSLCKMLCIFVQDAVCHCVRWFVACERRFRNYA